MYSYIYKNFIKNIADVSLKTPHLSFLNVRLFSDSVKNDSTVCLFKNYGFTEPQITSLLSKRPALLSLNEDKIIRPRLELFTSYGFSSADICHILISDIEILKRSIKNQIIPCCEFLKSVARDNESFIGIVKRSTWVLKHNYKYNMKPNIEVLRDYGVPESRIERFLRYQPRALMVDNERFKMTVREVLEMGFEPVKSHFLRAFNVVFGLSKETRDRKWDLYRKWGWTDDEILVAFRKQPGVLVASEEKVEQLFEFLIKKMGWSASEVWSCPIVIMHSFENWTVPRCLVVQFLLSKGLLSKKNITLSMVIVPMENRFKESETMWKRKWDHYKKWGWSDDEILSAFTGQPQIMAVSGKKVNWVMDFLVNKMGWKISKISCCPAVVMHSLENCTVPRCLVIQFLMSKGVISEDLHLSTVIVSLESRFVENFVAKYCADFPEVLQLYARKSEEATGHLNV